MLSADFFARERAAAIGWARDLLTRADWVILDTETTGLGPSAEVCQVGVLLPNGDAVLDMLVRPTCPIEPEATAIHGITDADVRYVAGFRPVGEVISQLAGCHNVVIYNAAFDERILHQSARAVGMPWFGLRAHCAMEEYARFIGEWNSYYASFRWQKLPPLYGVDAHSAIADCRATLALIRRMAEAIE